VNSLRLRCDLQKRSIIKDTYEGGQECGELKILETWRSIDVSLTFPLLHENHSQLIETPDI